MQSILRKLWQLSQKHSVDQRRARRTLNLMVVLAMIFALLSVAFTPQRSAAANVNVLQNGSFEQGFAPQGGCGQVGSGWQCFTNGGAANYGFYDDQWQPTVGDGKHSQLIEINAKGISAPDADRYAGIYQTVAVVDWAEYTLNLSGMIRTTVAGGDPWRYRVQVGWSAGRNANWQTVTNWKDVGWDTYYQRLSPGAFLNYSTKFMAEDDYVTLYVRAWKKWGVAEEEIDINLDGIALTGPALWAADMGVQPVVQAGPDPNAVAQPAMPQPAMASQGTTTCKEVVVNGGFEQGFNPLAIGHVGKSWGQFTNDGAANYGFYDDQWPPVVAEGQHSQLIEINTKGIAAGDADRYAGIYQRISGLKVGAQVELTIKGMLRGAGNADDANRFEAQWGWNAGNNTDWKQVKNWAGMNLGPIYVRTEPGTLGTYTMRFAAPATDLVLFVRGWKKWGVAEVEMDLNLDAISLRSCTTTTQPVPHSPQQPQQPPAMCSYIVQPGDALSMIAQMNWTTVEKLMWLNDIANPNIIYVGQMIKLPGCADQAPSVSQPPVYMPPPPPVVQPPQRRTYTVQPGDTLSGIAAYCGLDMYALAWANGINDPNLIYVGQVLVVPG